MATATQTPPPAIYRLPLAEEQDDRRRRPRVAVSEGPLLAANARWFCRLRWLVVALLSVVGVVALSPSALAPLGLAISPRLPLATAAILAVANLVYTLLLSAAGPDHLPRSIRGQLWLQILGDLAVLTVVVQRLGSIETPAALMYLFHIILACIFFSLAESLAVLVLASFLYASCLLLEGLGWITPVSVVADADLMARAVDSARFWVIHIVPTVAIWAVIWYLTSRLSRALHQREERLAVAHARLKASVAERAKHMLETTHELKSPFAAIHAYTQVLLGGYAGPLAPQTREIVEKIAERCITLSQQLVDMLQLANLRSGGQTAAAPSEIDVADVLRATIARLEPAAALRGIKIGAELQPVALRAVEDHLKMLFDNLLSNAINYSFDGKLVFVGCQPRDGRATVVIRDQGIGIPEEQLPKIFNDYYRTREAARHNRSSTGLGLAVVRQVARAAGIDVEVQSRPGWGTQFTLVIPPCPPRAAASAEAD